MSDHAQLTDREDIDVAELTDAADNDGTVESAAIEHRDVPEDGPEIEPAIEPENEPENGARDVISSDVESGGAKDGPVEGADGTSAPSRSNRLKALEREGEVAADFLETLLDIADADGDIDVGIDGDRAAVAIVDSEDGRVPRRLVGPDGKTLEALQELTRLAVQAVTGERSRLMLDVADYRRDRRAVLVALAQEAIAQVRESGQEKALENMSAFERKVVHDEVTAAGLHSESEGVEPRRHIVISPA